MKLCSHIIYKKIDPWRRRIDTLLPPEILRFYAGLIFSFSPRIRTTVVRSSMQRQHFIHSWNVCVWWGVVAYLSWWTTFYLNTSIYQSMVGDMCPSQVYFHSTLSWVEGRFIKTTLWVLNYSCCYDTVSKPTKLPYWACSKWEPAQFRANANVLVCFKKFLWSCVAHGHLQIHFLIQPVGQPSYYARILNKYRSKGIIMHIWITFEENNNARETI